MRGFSSQAKTKETGMNLKTQRAAVLVGAALLALAGAASAQTVRIANQGDALSLDPHSLNESLQLSVDSNAYEALVGWNKKLEMVPMLATSWKQTSPTVWRFELRKGVQFYDGTPFTADDVLFTLGRIMADGSDMKSYGTDIKDSRKIDEHTIEIETKAPQPILPQILSQVYIMSKKWCEANNAVKPVDRRKGVENTASFKTNGTGPYHVRERQPGVRTVFVRNPLLGQGRGQRAGGRLHAHRQPATRVAALLSGEVDVMEPVPVQDIARVNANPGTHVIAGPSCAPSSWAWTRSATSCCTPT
jgi:peptide/nickel transport system substrate-binding protein